MQELQKWAKIPQAATYAGISVRTMRRWMEEGLPYARLESGTILIKFQNIDEYLTSFSTKKQDITIM